MIISRPLRLNSQSTQRKQFLFVGEGPTNKKVSALLGRRPEDLKENRSNPEPNVVRGISPILLNQILLRDLCALCERRSVIT